MSAEPELDVAGDVEEIRPLELLDRVARIHGWRLRLAAETTVRVRFGGARRMVAQEHSKTELASLALYEGDELIARLPLNGAGGELTLDAAAAWVLEWLAENDLLG